ncbi:MAG: glycosyltransferase family 4 protein [Bacteroidota bacterium]
MQILVHDYGGYALCIALSRALAAQGHTVNHVYCASIANTGQGPLARQPDDPPGLHIEAIDLGEPINKYNYVKRWQQERAYGRVLARHARTLRPDVVLSGNAPLDAQRMLQRWAKQQGIPFVFWLQDVLGIATAHVLKQKLGVLGQVVGAYYLAVEQKLLQRSEHVVAITNDFAPLMREWGIKPSHWSVIENWAPLHELPVRLKDNPWSQAKGLAERLVLMYTGNLGMKHNPGRLVALAKHLMPHEAEVVVVSEGLGADWLKAQVEVEQLSNLTVLGFQPYDVLPDVLGTADVLVALLEPSAGQYSVPSKVLSYLCAERPILLSVPTANLAARIVAERGAGRVAPPDAETTFLRHAAEMLESREDRRAMGRAGRKYAEAHFEIGAIAERFASIFRSLQP